MEDAILAAMDADAWLGNSTNIKTREARVREIPVDISARPFYGFEVEEMPALFVAMRTRDDAAWDDRTYGEMEVTVPFVIAGVVFGNGESEVLEVARDIREKIEDFVRAEVRKATVFGQANDILEAESIKAANPIEKLGAGGYVGFPQVEFDINRAKIT